MFFLISFLYGSLFSFSHKIIYQADSSWNQKKLPSYKQNKQANPTIIFYTLNPGEKTAVHKHTYPQIAYVSTGTLEVKDEYGNCHIFNKGDYFSEVVDTWHQGINRGKEVLQLIVFCAKTKNEPISILKNQ